MSKSAARQRKNRRSGTADKASNDSSASGQGLSNSTDFESKQKSKSPRKKTCDKPPSKNDKEGFFRLLFAALQKYIFSRRRFYLVLGIFIGCIAAYVFQDPKFHQFAPHIHSTMQDIMNDFSNRSLSIQKMLDEWHIGDSFSRSEILESFDYRPRTSGADRPGLLYQQRNITAFSPVVMVPGFTSTGLEIWEGKECAKMYFRQRIWGTSRMFQQFMVNQKCWLDHLTLNRTTGLDPDGIKLRAAQGLEAADYVVGGYWVWGKIIENLADIGYDSNSMFMAPYDWRLAPALNEERDKFFTKLRFTIEMAVASNNGRKVVLMGHSFGSLLILHFMNWVRSSHKEGGNLGEEWISNHINTFVNIAGPMLGLPKSVSTLASGEMRDTADLGVLSNVLEYFFNPPSRAALVRSWASLISMLPMGGETIWGGMDSAPDDCEAKKVLEVVELKEQSGDSQDERLEQLCEAEDYIPSQGSNGQILRFSDGSRANVTARNVASFIEGLDPGLSPIINQFHYDIVYDEIYNNSKYDHPKYWTNALASTLPNSPNFKVYCLYGVGKPVERSFSFRKSHREFLKHEANVPYALDVGLTLPPWTSAGIRFSEGDGSVPLISLGFMCSHGWKHKRYNPANASVTIREYKHTPLSMFNDPRGGPTTADHVDIMGNHQMISDILEIVSKAPDLDEKVYSNIYNISARVNLDRRD